MFEFALGVVCLFRSFNVCCVLEVFEKCTEDSSRQKAHNGHRTPKNILVRFFVKLVGFWSDFQGKLVRKSVRFW